MDTVYFSSDSYCEIAGISILSLLEHNRKVKELNLYLIDNQISAENKQKLENMIASFGRTLTYLAHPDIEKRSATEITSAAGTSARSTACSCPPCCLKR